MMVEFIIMRNQVRNAGRFNISRARFCAAALALAASCEVAAQGFPNKAVTIIAPSSPGGPVDFTARLVAPPLAKLLGQQIVKIGRAHV